MQGRVIGIAGGSGSGKTTIADKLTQLIRTPTCRLAFDSYYRDQSHREFDEREDVNYDHPDSLDTDRFIADLRILKNGYPLNAPKYDFSKHNRSQDTELIEPAPIIVVEGILLFVFSEICELLDLKVFVDAPDKVRTMRRLDRDTSERGRTEEFAIAQIERTVRPMYNQFVKPTRKKAHLVVDGTLDILLAANQVLEAFKELHVGTTTTS